MRQSRNRRQGVSQDRAMPEVRVLGGRQSSLKIDELLAYVANSTCSFKYIFVRIDVDVEEVGGETKHVGAGDG